MILDEHNYLNDLNNFTKPYFVSFAQKVQALGYDILIQFPTYDTLAQSITLHNQDQRNPIYNFHEFGIAWDNNIIWNKGQKDERIYLKHDVIDDWIRTGVPEIAKNSNIRWGGSFNGYPDCVHFDLANILVEKYKLEDVYQLIDVLVEKAKAQFGQDLTKSQLNKMIL
jgi:hypothetical protein